MSDKIREILLDKNLSSLTARALVFVELGGEMADFLTAHDLPGCTTFSEASTPKVRKISNAIICTIFETYKYITGNDYPVPRDGDKKGGILFGQIKRISNLLTDEQMAQIGQFCRDSFDKQKKGVSLTFQEKRIISEWNVNSLLKNAVMYLSWAANTKPKIEHDFNNGGTI